MTKLQKSLLELAYKIHIMCEKKSLNYYMVGPELLFSVRDNTIKGYELDLAMFLKDWECLQETIKKDESLEIESILDGGQMPGCYFRIVNRHTLFLDLDRLGFFVKNGIAVNIHIIRNSGEKADALSRIEKGMEYFCKNEKTPERRSYQTMRTLMGKSKCHEKIMNMMRETAANKAGNNKEVREPDLGVCLFSENIWKKAAVISVSGVELKTVSDQENYFQCVYGENWDTEEPFFNRKSFKCIFSDTISYKSYLENPLVTETLDRIEKGEYLAYAKKQAVYETMRENEEEGWDKTLFLARERYRLWKKYMPIKGELLDLAKIREYDELIFILEDYMNEMEKYLEKDIVICFDADILSVMKEIYIYLEQQDIAQKITECVLEEDLKPIEVTW